MTSCPGSSGAYEAVCRLKRASPWVISIAQGQPTPQPSQQPLHRGSGKAVLGVHTAYWLCTSNEEQSVACWQAPRGSRRGSARGSWGLGARLQEGEIFSKEIFSWYRKVLGQAWKFELDRHRTVLFTCWHEGSSSLEDLDIRQILADEAGVASEPETLIPLVNFSQAEKVVLLGDHKQLRPVVRSELLQKLGLDRSLWQRYFRGACLWDVQYHMLSAQSSWAQGEFYERELKTWQGLGRPPSVLGHADEKGCSVIFGHLQSKEKSRLLSTDEEGEDSKAKDEEMAVVCIARELPLRGTVGPKDIAILTPYNAQVAEISKRLEHQEDVPRVTVCSITKIQGGAGTGWEACARGVRPVTDQEWLKNSLGVIADPSQVTVALARAQEGLCVIGDHYLLRCCPVWS
ncbi:hypothetical protein CB1_000220007 [Camelus ferus]|nr:hypothetical protein CB1_000220007 [Camelus ferus]